MSSPDAAALERALRDEGIACRVEARDRLAVLIPDASPAPGMPNAAVDLARRVARERALALARTLGFTHVALELPAPPTLTSPPGAGLPGA